MSICTQETSPGSTHRSMTNNHEVGSFAAISETLHVWRERIRTRHELAQWSRRDMHDAGVSWSEMAAEAEKPFWRA